jgi:tRNA threonylcarbamoyladenosine biosynthesis protein TsaB
MKTLLAIETATAQCSVALLYQGKRFERSDWVPQHHAQVLLPMVDEVLAESGLQAESLDALVLGEGPGAFTGLRIAAGVVQGLALGWNKPVISLSTLAGLARQGFNQTQQTKWLACLDARMGEVYVQVCTFNLSGDCMDKTEPALIKVADLAVYAQKYDVQSAVGDLRRQYAECAEPFSVWLDAEPQAAELAELAELAFDQGCYLQDSIPQPVYLRPSVV